MQSDEKQSKSWWGTIPGTITAIATLITAIGGLIVILKSLGVFDKHVNAETTTINATTPGDATAAKAEPLPQAATIHLESKLIIRFPYSYDLDAGIPYRTDESNADVDFVWEHPTSMDYEIRPDLGKFNLLGKIDFDGLDLPQLQKLEYSKKSINSDLLLKGAVIAVITKENRFGKFVVEEDNNFEPTIKLVIYDK